MLIDFASLSLQTDLEDLALESVGASNNSASWSIRYRVSAIEDSAESLVDIDVPVSNDDLRHIAKPELLQDSPLCEFQFPMAFGIDLQEIIVLHTIIRPRQASVAYPGDAVRLFDCQTIDFAPKGISSLERPYQEAEYPAWYRMWLSPARRFLAVTKRRGKPEVVAHNPWGVWSLTIWEDESQPNQGPSYRPLSEIYLNTTNLGEDGFLAFHPTLPLVVASGDIEAVCWNFKGQSKHLTSLHEPLSLIYFEKTLISERFITHHCPTSGSLLMATTSTLNLL